MRSLARRSPRSIFFASSTSSAAVRRSCFPISFMNSVTESVTTTGSASRRSSGSSSAPGSRSSSSSSATTSSTPRASSSVRTVASSSSSRSSSDAVAWSRRSSSTPSSTTSSMNLATTVSSRMVLISSSLFSGRRGSGASELEALDPATTQGFALDARVRRMTLRTHVEHELDTCGSDSERVAAGGAAYVRRYEIGMLPRH